MKSVSFPTQNSILHFLDQRQGTLLIDDCCNVIPFKQVVGGLELQHSPSSFGKKMVFSTRAKKVVMLLYHRAQNNWNTDKKTVLFMRQRRGVFLAAGKKAHTLKMLEKIKTA